MSKYQITVDGIAFDVEVGDVSSSPVQVMVNGQAKSVSFSEGSAAVAAPVAAAPAASAAPAPAPKPAPAASKAPVGSAAGTVVKAPMPGKILSVTVKVGQNVKEGDTICTLEAMKMEMPISSTASGAVAAIHVSVGDTVSNDASLVTVS